MLGEMGRRTGEAGSAILVLGMHRSGTSALAGALALLGVPLGSRMVAAASDNPTGYWEHADAVVAHEALLQELGRGWEDLRELPAGWLHSEAAARATAALEAMIQRDFAGKSVWALKDPRLCRLVPLWRQLLERSGIEPAFLFMVRSPEEVARSLQRRDGITPSHARLLWAQHVIEAERDTRGLRRAMLSYDSLLADPVRALTAVGEALGVAWPRSPEALGQELQGFLKQDLRHHRQVELSPAADGPAVLAGALFRDSLRIESAGGDWNAVADHAGELERLLAQATPWVEGLADALCRSRRNLSASEARLADTDRALDAASALSLQRLDELSAQAHRLDQTQSALAQVTQLSLQRLDELHAQAHRLGETQEALAQVTQLSLDRLAQVTQLAMDHQAQLAASEALLAQTNRAEEAQAALSQVLASRSWRYTRPLRWLERLVRRLPRGGIRP